MNKRKTISVIAIMTLLLIAGCNRLFPVKISDLYENTDKYQDKDIVVKGEVGISVSVLGFSGFILNDGTGNLLVVGYSPAPSPDDVVTVRGELSVPFRWQNEMVLVLKANSKGKK
jgi:hypothetical protein